MSGKAKVSPRVRRQARVRKKVRGTTERPRLCVFRSLGNIYVQVIDDEKGVTIAQASSIDPEFKAPEKPKPVEKPAVAAALPAAPEAAGKGAKKDKGAKKPEPEAKKKPAPVGYKVLCSQSVGSLIAKRLLEKGVKNVVFDRNGFLYHGRVRAVADAARKAGLAF